MRARSVPSKNALLSGSGLAALLLAAWCSPTFAANEVDIECPESERQNKLAVTDVELPELAVPSLTIEIAEHGVTSSANIDDEIVDVPLVSPAVSSADDIEAAATEVKETDATMNESPPAATRLPGVSETDQPRYRRQMYRTDI